MPPSIHIPIEVPKRRRGRPPGSKNKNTKVVELPPKEKPVVTPTAQSLELPFLAAQKKIQGIHLYNDRQIKAIEQQTGLVFVGNFAEQDSGALIPVFLRADRSLEDKQERLSWIRKG